MRGREDRGGGEGGREGATHSRFFWAVEQVDYIPGKRWGVEHGRSLGGHIQSVGQVGLSI